MTQVAQIHAHLKTGASITPIEALHDYGCFRLGARIWDLKQQGVRIETQLIRDQEKTFASYRLAEHG